MNYRAARVLADGSFAASQLAAACGQFVLFRSQFDSRYDLASPGLGEL